MPGTESAAGERGPRVPAFESGAGFLPSGESEQWPGRANLPCECWRPSRHRFPLDGRAQCSRLGGTLAAFPVAPPREGALRPSLAGEALPVTLLLQRRSLFGSPFAVMETAFWAPLPGLGRSFGYLASWPGLHFGHPWARGTFPSSLVWEETRWSFQGPATRIVTWAPRWLALVAPCEGNPPRSGRLGAAGQFPIPSPLAGEG